MNPMIRKFGLQIGLLLSMIQIIITIYLFNFGSFVDIRFGFLIITLNVFFGIITIYKVKKRQNNLITLRECFSGYFITILVSVILSSLFYVTLLNIFATNLKKESIKTELYNFQVKNMKDNDFSNKDFQKNIQLFKSSNPFSVAIALQSSIKFLILYSVLGILFSFIFKTKSSFQEITN